MGKYYVAKKDGFVVLNEILDKQQMGIGMRKQDLSLKNKIDETLANMKYISVRDTWTRDMMLAIGTTQNIEVTPDPVFSFNYNAGALVPSEEDLRIRFNLPKQYVLVLSLIHI